MRHFKLIIVTGLYFLDSITHTGPDDFTNTKVWAGVPDYRIYSHAHGEANAINKDRESLIFDRRADIHLTIDTEVSSHPPEFNLTHIKQIRL